MGVRRGEGGCQVGVQRMCVRCHKACFQIRHGGWVQRLGGFRDVCGCKFMRGIVLTMPGGVTEGFDWSINPGVCKTRRKMVPCNEWNVRMPKRREREREKQRAHKCSYMNEGVDARSEEL